MSHHLSVNEIGAGDVQIRWLPTKDAKYFELKTMLRIPEGKILLQREVRLEQLFFTLSKDLLLQQPYVHLVAELVAFCEDGKSETAFAQIALKNGATTCRFDASHPALNNEVLSWPSVPEADSYLVCFFKDADVVTCRETVDAQNKLTIERSRMVSIAPICHHASGATFFIPVMAD